jgi:hypothetical protein
MTSIRCFENNTELREAVLSYIADPSNDSDIATIYGYPINSWCTDQVTDFDSIFENADEFNEEIGDWDVSNATSMHQMFLNATSFNQSIEFWNVCRCSRF